MKKIGILRGMETTFPDGLVAHLNDEYGDRGIVAEMIEIGGISMDGEPGYAAILDRISHEVPFYRSYLKWASLKGTHVVNNPFWWSADDKFIDNVIAQGAGVAVPRSVILPHKEHPPNTQAASFRNLEYPVKWNEVFEYVGWPAFLKPFDGGGWRAVTKVRNEAEFFAAYDESGTDCMMLQESIEFEDYFRCYGIGQRSVRTMRYNPAASNAGTRYTEIDPTPIPADMLARVERDTLALCRALDYSMNTVEFAVRGGVPYAIDFMNPAPDADYWTVGAENYEWVVRTVGAFLVEKAFEERPAAQFTANGALEPARRGAGLMDVAKSAAQAVGEAASGAVDAVRKAVASRAKQKAADGGTSAKKVSRKKVAEFVKPAAPAMKAAPTPTPSTEPTPPPKAAPRAQAAPPSADAMPDQLRRPAKSRPAGAAARQASAGDSPSVPSQPTPGPGTETTAPAKATGRARKA